MARTFYISVEKRGTVTNGDMIKTIFSNCEVCEHKVNTNSQGEIVVGYDVFLYVHHPSKSDMGLGIGINVFFDAMWWDAPYNTESEVNTDE